LGGDIIALASFRQAKLRIGLSMPPLNSQISNHYCPVKVDKSVFEIIEI